MNLQTRVVNILTKPAAEWQVIAAESADIKSLYTNYIMILAAIPAVSTFLGTLFLGAAFGFYGFSGALVGGVLNYVGTLVSVIICAFIIEKLAPTFDSRGDTAQALKLVAYASTPVWVAGVLHVVPPLGVLILLAAIYAVYLFYLGLPPVMKTPADKVVAFMIVAAIIVIIVYFVIGAVFTLFAAMAVGGAMMGGRAF